MGIVYSANDTRLNRPVAFKMILDSGNDEESPRRFLHEAQAAARVTHLANLDAEHFSNQQPHSLCRSIDFCGVARSEAQHCSSRAASVECPKR